MSTTGYSHYVRGRPYPSITDRHPVQTRRKHGYRISTTSEAVMPLSGDSSDGNILIPTERGDGQCNSALVGSCHKASSVHLLDRFEEVCSGVFLASGMLCRSYCV